MLVLGSVDTGSFGQVVGVFWGHPFGQIQHLGHCEVFCSSESTNGHVNSEILIVALFS